jgi:hypothetical protein
MTVSVSDAATVRKEKAMPIEVNEIAIQLRVSDGESAEGEPVTVPGGVSLTQQERDAIVADCVSCVLRALKARRER